ncbi:MAG: heparan-alpha-glucosaminide N-acetyltransferase domain-containing protein [Syntrophales bacterium]
MTADSGNRVRSIDVMRGFALMCMVLVHFMVYFGDSTAANSPLHVFFNHALGDWGAACFLMMMGMSQVLSAKRRTPDNALFFQRALIRGGYIFLVGILMLALSKGPAAIWRWDILTLMGVATVLLFACRFIPSGLILLAGALIAVATPGLRAGIDFASLWGGPAVQVAVVSDWLPGILLDPGGEFDIIWKPQEVLRGFLLTGEFPLFPWLLFPPVGFVLGRRIVAGQIRGDLPFLAIIGILLVGLGLGGAYASLLRPGSSFVSDHLAPLSFYPDSFTMILYQLGMSLLVFAGLYFCYDVHGKAPSRVTFLVGLYNRTSRFSLTFYFLHYLLIGWPLMIATQIAGRNTALLGAAPSFLAGVAGLVFLETLLYVWEKRGARYSLEWWLGAITARLTTSGAR